ncbi:type II secretion system F family protein [Candidatus Woesearchaeota archaeon]|nr:type II secretion system F family protein [Candidatus Woesearchaeota archaeon]
MVFNQLTETVGKAFVFDRIRPHLRSYLLKAGIVGVPYTLFGLLFWLSIIPVSVLFIFFGWHYILTLQQGIIIQFILALTVWMVVHFAVLFAIILVIYLYLDLKIFDRTKKMEAVLPDFLRMVSENLKGGMPFEKALWGSIRPEFGILANEVMLSAKKVITGQDVDDALKSFTEKYDSPMMRRSFDLIIEGMKGGGKTADVIDRVIETIEETKELKEEMAATNLSYAIFVVIIVLFVAPGLFTLSFQFLTVLQGISGKISTATGGAESGAALPINFGNISIEPAVFQSFSINALLVISFFSSLMISIMQKGSIKAGVKYIPILMIASHVIYRVMMVVANSVFSGFIA